MQHTNEIYFSHLLDRPVYDSSGKTVGKLKDIAVRWDGGMPRVTGIRLSTKQHKLIPADAAGEWNRAGVKLVKAIEAINAVDICEEELYVRKWLLDKQIIDLKGSKLVRVNDILLSGSEEGEKPQLFLLAADVGIRGLLRRIGLEVLAGSLENRYISWQSISPLESRTGSLKLNRDKDQLKELHPADIADLVEDMDYNSRAAFMNSLGAEQAAEALAEMELDTQVEIITQMEGGQASDLLEEMPPDEAADILSEMTEEQSSELLRLMEADDAEEVKELMQYEEDTAGGLMTTEYIGLPASLTVDQTINRLRELAPAAETIYYLYVVNEEEKLLGVLSLRELIIARPEASLGSLMHTKVIALHYEDDHRKIVETIHKYGLLAVPVTDEQGGLLGIITVDDVIDLLMPERSMPEAMSSYLKKRAVGRW